MATNQDSQDELIHVDDRNTGLGKKWLDQTTVKDLTWIYRLCESWKFETEKMNRTTALRVSVLERYLFTKISCPEYQIWFIYYQSIS